MPAERLRHPARAARHYAGESTTVKGPERPPGRTTGTPSIDNSAALGAPRTIVERPVSESETDAPGVNVCARTVAPLADVTLIQQSAVVAPTESEYEEVAGA